MSVDEIMDVLATGTDRPLRFGATVNQLDHALQTAALLRAERPDDPELAVAGLHVHAKRYLVATEPEYGNLLAQDSVASMREQGGAMSTAEAAAFATHPLASDAVLLRRADDSGKVDGLAVPGLADWVSFLRRVSAEHREADPATA
jgi:predicted HD phosphohydrolase